MVLHNRDYPKREPVLNRLKSDHKHHSFVLVLSGGNLSVNASSLAKTHYALSIFTGRNFIIPLFLQAKYCTLISLYCNIPPSYKYVNKDLHFSRAENTYKIRNCFSVIKIHFSQSLKQYHPLSSLRNTMAVNYH